MAITQAMCTSFKTELLLGVHRFAPTGLVLQARLNLLYILLGQH